MLAARPVLLAAMASQARRNFQLTAKTVLVLQQGDITKTKCDAIVNAANERMLGGGGVDGAIHRAAGPQLREACQAVPTVRPGVRCPTGEARITRAFDLPAEAVIHTVGPVYSSPKESAKLLKSAYQQSLGLANREALRTVAFPAISCGVYGYPYDEAAQIALEAAAESAADLEEVRFVLFGQPAYQAWLEAAERLGLEPVS